VAYFGVIQRSCLLVLNILPIILCCRNVVAAMCAGRGFPARHVIHVNSPTWKSQSSSVQQLETAVVNVLKAAEEKQLKVLAVPSISSGQLVT